MSDQLNVKRPQEMQGALTLCPALGFDPNDGGSSPIYFNWSGKALQLNGQDVTQTKSANAPLVSAPVSVLPLPRVAATTLVSTRAGLVSVDSVTLVDGDLVLLLAQGDATGGLWVAHANIDGVAQSWTRPVLPIYSGQLYQVQAGTANHGKLIRNTTVGAITVGTTVQTFDQIQGASTGSSGSAFDPASPGPIGGTTPAAITGTRITATSGFTGVVGDVTPAAGTFTTLGGTVVTASTAVKLPAVVIGSPTATTLTLYGTSAGTTLALQNATGDVLNISQLASSGSAVESKRFGVVSLADDASLDITGLGLGGHGTVTALGASSTTSGHFSYAADGTTSLNGVTITNFAAADTDTKLCVFANAGALRVRNRLGSTLNILVELFQASSA